MTVLHAPRRAAPGPAASVVAASCSGDDAPEGTTLSLPGARDAIVAGSTGSRLDNSESIEIDGRSGPQLAVLHGNGTTYLSRVVAEGTHLYQLIDAGAGVSPDDPAGPHVLRLAADRGGRMSERANQHHGAEGSRAHHAPAPKVALHGPAEV